MKEDSTFSIMKNAFKMIEDPYSMVSEQFANTPGANKLMNTLDKINRAIVKPLGEMHNGYEGDEPADRIEDYSGDSSGLEEYKDYYEESNNNIQFNKENENTKSCEKDSMGLIDSITQEITPVRLQQAIIMSEIVGKPRSKTRKRRRF